MSDINCEVEQGSGNIYTDLGMTNAEEMLLKANLAAKIAETINHRHLTVDEVADIVLLPQPKLTDLLRGQFRGISEFQMLDCLKRLGHEA